MQWGKFTNKMQHSKKEGSQQSQMNQSKRVGKKERECNGLTNTLKEFCFRLQFVTLRSSSKHQNETKAK